MKSPFIDARDVFIFIGLSCIGAGLFFCFGLGAALVVDGLIITALAVFGK